MAIWFITVAIVFPATISSNTQCVGRIQGWTKGLEEIGEHVCIHLYSMPCFLFVTSVHLVLYPTMVNFVVL